MIVLKTCGLLYSEVLIKIFVEKMSEVPAILNLSENPVTAAAKQSAYALSAREVSSTASMVVIYIPKIPAPAGFVCFADCAAVLLRFKHLIKVLLRQAEFS